MIKFIKESAQLTQYQTKKKKIMIMIEIINTNEISQLLEI
jgi:hypothetical protein